MNMDSKKEIKVLPLDEFVPNKDYDENVVFEWKEDERYQFDTDIIRMFEEDGIDVSDIKRTVE